MKRRLISLALCVIMVLSTFILGSCDGDPVVPPAEDYPKITIYGIKEEGTTDKAIKNVEAALSEIAIKKCGVAVELHLFTEEEYAPILFSKVKAEMERYNNEVESLRPEDEENMDVVLEELLATLKDVDYSGYEDIKVSEELPEDVANASLDIFLAYTPKADSPVLDPESESYNPVLKDCGMFNILFEQNALYGLLSKLESDFTELNSSVYPKAFSAIKNQVYALTGIYTGEVYGIPNTTTYGGYEFILFDNEYVSKVWQPERDKADLVAVTEEGGDSDALTALIAELTACKANGEIPEDVEIRKEFASYEEYSAYVLSGGKMCIGIVNGGLSVKELCEQSGRYQVEQRKVNSTTNKTLIESMFCISPSAMRIEDGELSETRLDQALNVLTLLNTNEEFRNVFQYGVKDTHYSLGRDGVAHITGTLTERYVMDPLYCGNCLIMYPSDMMDAEQLGLAENNWGLGKLQIKEVFDNPVINDSPLITPPQGSEETPEQ